MPLYEYILEVDGNEKARVCIPLPVADRDKVTLTRAALPRSLIVSGSAENPHDQKTQVLNTYKRAEQRIGNNSEFRSKIGHSPEAVKRAWAQPAL